MEIKKIIKCFVGFLRCKLAHVNSRGGVYVGRNVHFVNGRNIFLGTGVQIRPNVDLFAGEKIEIGNGCDIGTRNRLGGNIIIEKEVLIGPDNYLVTWDHCYTDINKSIILQGATTISKNEHSEMIIGEGSWIGTHCAIIGCVHIGKHCVIGANTVVTKDIPDYSVVVGNPARIIKRYNPTSGQWEIISK